MYIISHDLQGSLMRCPELFLSDSLGHHGPQRFSSKLKITETIK